MHTTVKKKKLCTQVTFPLPTIPTIVCFSLFHCSPHLLICHLPHYCRAPLIKSINSLTIEALKMRKRWKKKKRSRTWRVHISHSSWYCFMDWINKYAAFIYLYAYLYTNASTNIDILIGEQAFVISSDQEENWFHKYYSPA